VNHILANCSAAQEHLAGRRAFLGGDDALVIMNRGTSQKEFWRLTC
jgi:hypothetical protein